MTWDAVPGVPCHRTVCRRLEKLPALPLGPTISWRECWAVLLVLWRVLATSGGGDTPADSSFLEELDLDEAEQARLQDIEALIKENPDEAVAGFLGLVRGKEPAA